MMHNTGNGKTEIKSFLEALQCGEIGGFQALLDDVHGIALAEDARRQEKTLPRTLPTYTMPGGPLVIDGRTFAHWRRQPVTAMVRLLDLTEDDISWALSRLGQYVAGQSDAANFRAYVAEVSGGNLDGDRKGTVGLILEELGPR